MLLASLLVILSCSEAALAVDRSSFRFTHPETDALHAALEAHVPTVSSGWRHRPIASAGNWLTERWCSPDLPDAVCEGGAVPDVGGWIALSTLQYPKRAPEVFGVVYEAWTAADGAGRIVH